MTKEINMLIDALDKIREKKGSASPEAKAIRIKLRKLGYSLRHGCMKDEVEEEETPKKKKVVQEEKPTKKIKPTKRVVEDDEEEEEEEEEE